MVRGNENTRATTRAPALTTIALFQSLQGGRLRRCQLEDILFTVGVHQAKMRGSRFGLPTSKRGYMTHLFEYHLNCGRLHRVKDGSKVYYSLSTKGYEYANVRGLFK